MDAKFTPGPWKRDGQDVTGPQGFIIAVIAATDEGGRRYKPENGHLIAAAPDLYAALVALVGGSRSIFKSPDMILVEQADAAIAKAEGRQP